MGGTGARCLSDKQIVHTVNVNARPCRLLLVPSNVPHTLGPPDPVTQTR